MWLITPRGFYSAVAKADDGDEFVTVRARSEQDIRNLSDLIDAEPVRGAGTDYPWRLRCAKAEWAEAVRQMALEIDYDNFKNHIHEADARRAKILAGVWRDLLEIERAR
jgi:hypothetical protein